MNREKRRKKRKERAKQLRIELVGAKRHCNIPQFITKIDENGCKTKVNNPEWFILKREGNEDNDND